VRLRTEYKKYDAILALRRMRLEFWVIGAQSPFLRHRNIGAKGAFNPVEQRHAPSAALEASRRITRFCNRPSAAASADRFPQVLRHCFMQEARPPAGRDVGRARADPPWG